MAKKSKSKKDQEKRETGGQVLVHKSRPAGGDKTLHAIAFSGLALLLFLPPFFRGLFFAEDQRKALILAALIFLAVWLWKWLRRDSSFLSHPLDYGMLALPLAYGISAFNAVNYGLAVDEIIEAALYFLIYWCVVQLVRDCRDAEGLLYVAYTSAVGVALAGLMTTTGLVFIKDGLQGERIASTLQYPNALASYLVAVFILGVYLWWRHTHTGKGQEIKNDMVKSNKYTSYLFAIGNFILATVIIGTKSNGGLFVFILAALMMFFFLPGWNRFFAFVHLAKVTVPTAVAMSFFIKNAYVGKHYGQVWLWIFSGILLVAALQWLYLRLIPGVSFNPKAFRRVIVAGVICLVVLGLILSQTNIDSLSKITKAIKIYSLVDRAYFIEDALKMIKERPFLGWGGGGWKEAYQYYQSYSYISTQVHSYYIQTTVETGITGFLILAGIGVAFLMSSHRAYRRYTDIKDKMLIMLLTIAAVTLGVHAAVDFDLSLSAISLVLYSVMAIIRAMDKGYDAAQVISQNMNKNVFKKSPFFLALSSGLIILIFTSCLMTARSYAIESTVLLNQNNVEKAISIMEKAVVYDPFRAEYNAGLVELYLRQSQKDSAWANAVEYSIKSKYNPRSRFYMSNIAFQRGDFNEAARMIEEAISLAPWVIQNYEVAAYIYKTAGLTELKNNNHASAENYFKAATSLPTRIRDKIDSLEPEKRKRSSNFDVTPKIALAAGVGHMLTGNLDEAGKSLELAVKTNDNSTKGEALVWLSIMSEKSGNAESAEEYLNRAIQILPENKMNYEEIKKLLQLRQ
ncbi:MAG: O-antigen ligase family protein [Bacillota bacterium]